MISLMEREDWSLIKDIIKVLSRTINLKAKEYLKIKILNIKEILWMEKNKAKAKLLLKIKYKYIQFINLII